MPFGQIIRLMLNANGIRTIDRTRIGATPVVRKCAVDREIDLYVEYTGNAGFFYNDAAKPCLEGPRAGLRARLATGLRGQPHCLACPGTREQRLGTGHPPRRGARPITSRP